MVTSLLRIKGRASRGVFWMAVISNGVFSFFFQLGLFVFFGGPQKELQQLYRMATATVMIASPLFNPAGFFEFLGYLVCSCVPGTKFGAQYTQYPSAIVLILAGLSFTSWIFVVVGVRRLQDRDKPGGRILIYWLAPIILVCIACDTNGIIRQVARAGALVVSACAFIELGCAHGTDGPNQYGPDPLDEPTET